MSNSCIVRPTGRVYTARCTTGCTIAAKCKHRVSITAGRRHGRRVRLTVRRPVTRRSWLPILQQSVLGAECSRPSCRRRRHRRRRRARERGSAARGRRRTGATSVRRRRRPRPRHRASRSSAARAPAVETRPTLCVYDIRGSDGHKTIAILWV